MGHYKTPKGWTEEQAAAYAARLDAFRAKLEADAAERARRELAAAELAARQLAFDF